jgi:hypothetical protein
MKESDPLLKLNASENLYYFILLGVIIPHR